MYEKEQRGRYKEKDILIQRKRERVRVRKLGSEWESQRERKKYSRKSVRKSQQGRGEICWSKEREWQREWNWGRQWESVWESERPRDN